MSEPIIEQCWRVGGEVEMQSNGKCPECGVPGHASAHPGSTLLDLTNEVERLAAEREEMLEGINGANIASAAILSEVRKERDAALARLATSEAEVSRLIDTGQARIAEVEVEVERDEALARFAAMRAERDEACVQGGVFRAQWLGANSDVERLIRERDSLKDDVASAISGRDHAVRESIAMEAERNSLRAQLEQAQAEAAAMREAMGPNAKDAKAEFVRLTTAADALGVGLNRTRLDELLSLLDRVAALSGQGKATP